jgi:hypothetical protein
MKKLLPLLFLLLAFSAGAQQRVLELTRNDDSGKMKSFEENTRVKARTTDGRKYVGPLQIKDEETLAVDGTDIPLAGLLSIKSQPKVLGTLKTVLLITGVALVGSSIIVAAGGGNAAFLLFTSGAAITVGSGILDAANSNNTTRKWAFKIVNRP